MVKTVVNIDIPFTFPLGNLAITLAGTIQLGLLITLLPIRRAVHYPPGEALRYAEDSEPVRGPSVTSRSAAVSCRLRPANRCRTIRPGSCSDRRG